MTMTRDEQNYQRRLEERAAEQLRRHLADPHREPKYIPADDDELPCDAWTAGWRQERGA